MSSTNLSLNLQTRKQVTWAAVAALVGVTYFALAIFVLHFLRTDLSPISQPTSRYAVGPYGYLMNTAFFSMSVASIALVIALYQSMTHSAQSRTGLAFFALWGIGVLVAMIFPMDVEGAPQTLSGTIHNGTGPLAFLCMAVGVFLLSRSFKQTEEWHRIYRTALVLSFLLLAGYVATLLSFLSGSGSLGVFQRLTLATLVVWMVLASCRLVTRP